jgi:hypothetical protein
MTLTEAIKNAKENVKDEFALTYLNAIPEAIEFGGNCLDKTAEESLKFQLLYALCNMHHWKGSLARESKKVIKNYATKKDQE